MPNFINDFLNNPKVVRFFTAVTPGSSALVNRADVPLNFTSVVSEMGVGLDAVKKQATAKTERVILTAKRTLGNVVAQQAFQELNHSVQAANTARKAELDKEFSDNAEMASAFDAEMMSARDDAEMGSFEQDPVELFEEFLKAEAAREKVAAQKDINAAAKKAKREEAAKPVVFATQTNSPSIVAEIQKKQADALADDFIAAARAARQAELAQINQMQAQKQAEEVDFGDDGDEDLTQAPKAVTFASKRKASAEPTVVYVDRPVEKIVVVEKIVEKPVHHYMHLRSSDRP